VKFPEINKDMLRRKLSLQTYREARGSRLMYTPNPIQTVLRKRNAAANVKEQLLGMDK
jgi:hypothetical protein